MMASARPVVMRVMIESLAQESQSWFALALVFSGMFVCI